MSRKIITAAAILGVACGCFFLSQASFPASCSAAARELSAGRDKDSRVLYKKCLKRARKMRGQARKQAILACRRLIR